MPCNRAASMLLAMVIATPLVGQEGAQGGSVAPEAGGSQRSRLLEEVIVTAQKREEASQEVPISLQAFGEEQLEARGVLDAADLPSISAGLTVTSQLGYVSSFIRGIGTDAFLFADPSVVTYVDGAYFPVALSSIQDFGAVERIEVLKGPQGTLFGRNALGGAISIVSRKPSFEAVEVSLQSIATRYDTTKNRLHVSVPILDNLAVSSSLVYNEFDPVADGFSAGQPLGRSRDRGERARLVWDIADRATLDIGSLRQKNDGAGQVYGVNTEPSDLGESLGVEPREMHRGANDVDLFSETFLKTYFGSLLFRFAPLDIKLFASKQYVEINQNVDFDGSEQQVAAFQVDPLAGEIKTRELQILSNDGSPFSEWLEWIIGAYQFDSTAGFERGLFRLNSADDFIVSLIGSLPPSSLVPTGDVNFSGLLSTESLAIYAQITADISEWMSLTLGVRSQEETRTLDESTAGLRYTDGSADNYQEFRNLDDTTESVDPKVALEFRPPWAWFGTDPLVYLSWQSATKSSTYNVVNLSDGPELVEAEELTAIELGLKTLAFNDSTILSMAVFDYVIDKPQVQFVSLRAGGAVTFENAGESTVKGAEFDIVSQLLPSVLDDWALAANAVYLDAIYSVYQNGSGFDPDSGAFTEGNDFSGNEVVRTPQWSGSISLTKTLFFGGNHRLELSANYYYNDGFFYSAQNSERDSEDAYGLFGAHVSYEYLPWRLRVTAFGRNLDNEEYALGRLPTDFGVNSYAAPRAAGGLRINWDYGG